MKRILYDAGVLNYIENSFLEILAYVTNYWRYNIRTKNWNFKGRIKGPEHQILLRGPHNVCYAPETRSNKYDQNFQSINIFWIPLSINYDFRTQYKRFHWNWIIESFNGKVEKLVEWKRVMVFHFLSHWEAGGRWICETNRSFGK